MKVEDVDKVLINRGVKPTANRIRVLKELMLANRPQSLADLEANLYPMDKTSVFRALEVLAENDILHVIEDGSRSLKYEICQGRSSHDLSDQHVHFYCERCKETFCFENVNVPAVDIPDGFRPRSVNYVVKGVCLKCNK